MEFDEKQKRQFRDNFYEMKNNFESKSKEQVRS